MISKQDLLGELEAEGISIGGNPERMLTSFVSRGLIKKPVILGRGKGKGTVSMFQDEAKDQIREIVSLKEEGLSYEEIKQKLESPKDWLTSIRKIKTSASSEEGALEAIKQLPVLSDSEKGRFKLTVDVAEHLSEVIVDELMFFFGDYEAPRKMLVKDVYSAIEFCLDNVFYAFGLGAEDYERYLAGKSSWNFPSSEQRALLALLKDDCQDGS